MPGQPSKLVSRCLLLLALTCLVAAAQDHAPPAQDVAFVTKVLPNGIVGRSYKFSLQADGGTKPYRWRILDPEKLPAGIELDQATGLLSGKPRTAGTFRVNVMLTDATGMPLRREFTLQILGLLDVQWKSFPAVQQDQILGSVEVSNYSEDAYDLTVVIVAVNEVGKAFALGYEHYDLPPSTEHREIAFGAQNNLPYGKYVVHVDAVGEVAARNSILRARLQTPNALNVASP